MRARIACVAVALSSVLLSAQPRRPMTVDDVLDLVQLSAPRISPDGGRILYTKSELGKWKENKRVATIWAVDADGTHARQFLSSDKDRSPAWSPDGRSVAFLSTRDAAKADDDASPQIWVIPVDGGEATRITEHKGTIKAFEWTKDSRAILFVAEREVSERETEARKSGDDAIYVDELANGQERAEFASIWRVSLDDRSERRLMKEDRLLIDSFKPSPDGSKVALVYRSQNVRNHQNEAEVAVLDVARGELTTLTHNQAPEQNVQWSPEGKLLSFLAPSDAAWELAEEKLWLVPAEGGPARALTPAFSGAIAQYAWSPDGQSIVFGAHVRGRAAGYRVRVSDGAIAPVTTAADRAGRIESVSADGTRGVAIVSTPTTPGEVALVNLSTGAFTQLTQTNPQAAGFALSQFRAISWKSKDGLEIEGMLWLPADYVPGKRLPLNLAVHGGPAGAWDVSFRAIDHVYTGLGWAVLEPNVRGSSSYGDALLRGNMRDIGGGDFQDLMTGVDKLIADGIADPDHLAITGWSYGGILGGWTLTQTQRFKAASLGAMVADWASEYAMGFNHDVRLWYIGGTPWESADAYRRQSAYTHIASVTTPTLLLHGERDTTDTIGQSMIYYQALKDRGVPTRFIRFPREPHGFREPHHQRTRDLEQIAWLMKYARGIDWKIPERPDTPPPAPKKTSDQP